MVCFALPHSRPAAEKPGLRRYWPAALLGGVLLWLGFRMAQPPAPAAPPRPALALQMKDVRPLPAVPAPSR